MLSKEVLQSGLATKTFGQKLFAFEAIDSTNACAKTLADVGIPEGTVVIADYQRRGRGRMGRVWTSEPGENLLFSVVVRPKISSERAPAITFLTAVAVAKAIQEMTNISPECKWPNDILLHRKKLCGILVENSFRNGEIEYSILGIGINVNQQSFPAPLNVSATSLALVTGKRFRRELVFQNVLLHLESWYHTLQTGGVGLIMNEWNRSCRMFGTIVTVALPDSTISGRAKTLDENGGLIIETETGERTVYAGDVTFRS